MFEYLLLWAAWHIMEAAAAVCVFTIAFACWFFSTWRKQ